MGVTLSSERIGQLLSASKRPLGLNELLRALGAQRSARRELKRLLRDMARKGEISKKGDRYSQPFSRGQRPQQHSERHSVTGTLHVHPDGFGFVHPDSGEGENIYLSPSEASRAMDRDRVRVHSIQSRGRTEGRLAKIVERRRRQIIGTYQVRGNRAFVVPEDATIAGTIQVPPTQLAQSGDLVKVQLVGLGDHSGGRPTGEVTGSAGRPGTPSVSILSLAYAQGFSDEFPADVVREASAVGPVVTAEEAQSDNRRDLRHLSLVTIDGEDARDFDDAVWAERSAAGYRLVVAIADVSHYVRPGSALDREALFRGTSVYLPNRVLPMLPERLSAGICSLRPEEDRLCVVADIQLSREGNRRSVELYPAVMRSRARCTYSEVQDVLDGKEVPHRAAFRELFQLLAEVARSLNRMREQRGAIDFELSEYKVVLDDQDMPKHIDQRERLFAHRLIEECMLAANEAVAHFFLGRKLPTIFRFHGEPDEEKLAAFNELAKAFGFFLPPKPTSGELSQFLKQLRGHPEQRALNQLLLRSMMQAVYSSEETAHYGLAAPSYLHFTSPIRRYPDLQVHRLLKSHWRHSERKPSAQALEAEVAALSAIAERSSERERAAVEVERQTLAFYSTLLMKDRVGEEFSATVSSLAEFGFFVQLDNEHVEGRVRTSSSQGSPRLDARSFSLIYPSGQRVRVGQSLKVRLKAANISRRQLEFELADAKSESAERPRPLPEKHSRAHVESESMSPAKRGRKKTKRGSTRGAGGRKSTKGAGRKKTGSKRGRRKTPKTAKRGLGPGTLRSKTPGGGGRGRKRK
jgi:ribonuclease R